MPKKPNTKREGVLYLKKVMNKSDYQDMQKAVAIAKGDLIGNGFSISTSEEQLKKVVNLIGRMVDAEDSYVRGTAKNILQHAKKQSETGFWKVNDQQIFITD
jgi:hypothetical protein